jgi:hypothetical protein
MATQKVQTPVVATTNNLAKLQAAASIMFRAPTKRGGGQPEQPLDDGTTYDQLCEVLIQAGPGKEVALLEGIHFQKGVKLQSIESRIRKALANPDRRDENHRLAAQHVTVKAIPAGQAIVEGEMVSFPNCLVIGTNPLIAEKYDALATVKGWEPREEEEPADTLQAVG